MATVSGRVMFDKNRSSTIDASDQGIGNIPIILQSRTTGLGLVVNTNVNGEYVFNNVTDDKYIIVEAFGTTGGVQTPGDFNLAVFGIVPIAKDPPISFVTMPPTGSTNLDSLTPNTILIEITDGVNKINQDFLDGPVRYTPIENIIDLGLSVQNKNLISSASNGSFGFFPPGTNPNKGSQLESYPGVTPGFTYVVPNPSDYALIDGEYTVQNIMSNALSNEIGAWWRIADHSNGDETGKMMVVNGFNPGAVLFQETLLVSPNTNYLFSCWILNLFKIVGFPTPQLGVQIIGSNGEILYSEILDVEIPTNVNVPEWKEIGTVINSQNNTNITLKFLNEGEAVIGNAYAIDDISLRPVMVPKFTPVTTANRISLNVGEIVTYTVAISNTCSNPLTNVSLTDIIPRGLSFIPGSVTINTSPYVDVNPNNGFYLPNIQGDTTVTVTFDVRAEFVPNTNPTINTATIDYSYTPVDGGISSNYLQISNNVLVNIINSADISITKSTRSTSACQGDLIVYTIVVTNLGPADAENVILIDDISDSISNPEFSIDGGATWNTWFGFYNIGTLQNATTVFILIKGRICSSARETIRNIARVISTTQDPNKDNNTSTVCTIIKNYCESCHNNCDPYCKDCSSSHNSCSFNYDSNDKYYNSYDSQYYEP